MEYEKVQATLGKTSVEVPRSLDFGRNYGDANVVAELLKQRVLGIICQLYLMK